MWRVFRATLGARCFARFCAWAYAYFNACAGAFRACARDTKIGVSRKIVGEGVLAWNRSKSGREAPKKGAQPGRMV